MPQTLKNIGNSGEIVLYQPDDSLSLEVKLENETVWLSQQQMATLFDTTKQNVSLHINNIFKEGELNKNSVVKESLTTASDGKCYKTKSFNLDVIISVGYRIKSIQGTRFRQWALNILKEYMLKGYAVNQRMLVPQTHQKLIENVNTRLTAVEQRVDFFVNTAHHGERVSRQIHLSGFRERQRETFPLRSIMHKIRRPKAATMLA